MSIDQLTSVGQPCTTFRRDGVRRSARGAVAALAGACAVALAAPSGAGAVVTDSPTPAASSTRVDVDGDGRPDYTELKKVRVTRSFHIFRLTTKTATKRTFSTDIRVPRERDDLKASDVWVGAAGIDGVRGGEVIVDRGGGVGDFPYSFVYTVRKGKWQLLLAPGAKSTETNWNIANHPAFVAGYEFSTGSNGVRRVIATTLQAEYGTWDDPIYGGKRVTYRWTNTGWRHSGTVNVKKVPDKQAQEWSGWNGLIWRK